MAELFFGEVYICLVDKSSAFLVTVYCVLALPCLKSSLHFNTTGPIFNTVFCTPILVPASVFLMGICNVDTALGASIVFVQMRYRRSVILGKLSSNTAVHHIACNNL